MRKNPIYHNIGGRLSDWQRDFIKKNCQYMNGTEIAKRIGRSPSLVYDYCTKHGYELKKGEPGRKEGEDYYPSSSGATFSARAIVRVKQEPPKPKLVRPPAVYTNRTQDQLIDYYLNLKL